MLRGRPTLRGPDGERQLDEGEVVDFPVGPDGHRVYATTPTGCSLHRRRHPSLTRGRGIPRRQEDHSSGAHRLADGRATLDDSRRRYRSGFSKRLTRLLPS